MCEQCLTNPLYYGEALPGWYLVRARREGNDMKVGQWGLLQINDPDFIWTSSPTPLDEESWQPEDFDDAMYGVHVNCGYTLIKACMEKGYDPEKDGHNVAGWLFDFLGKYIQSATPTTDSDPFPHLDALKPHDYSLK